MIRLLASKEYCGAGPEPAQEPEHLPRPLPLPDRKPWPPSNTSSRHPAQWLDRGAVGFLRNVFARKTPPTNAPMAMRSFASSISATKMVMLSGRMALFSGKQKPEELALDF